MTRSFESIIIKEYSNITIIRSDVSGNLAHINKENNEYTLLNKRVFFKYLKSYIKLIIQYHEKNN